jgi:hypothetical protein
MEDRHTSHHFRKRREETQKPAEKKRKSTFPKMAVLNDCQSHLVLDVRTNRGPGADHPYFIPMLDRAAETFRIDRILADAGFDSEDHHVHARRTHNTVAIIPPTIGRPTSKLPSKPHRRRMKTHWQRYKVYYGQRWQTETVMSMIKRLLGSALRAIRDCNRRKEMCLRALTLNVMIIAASS